MAEKLARHLHLVGATGSIRTAQYDGREHLVVPVVAMVEGVVWAVNSETPEFVSADELAQTPQQWNGRGAFAGHPADGGTQVTANTPRTLERSFGVIFDTASSERILRTRKLEFNVFVDAAKARKIGAAEEAVVNRLLAGDTDIEVSVGCYVETEDKDGRFNGKEYHGAWKSIVSDHIAFLAEGEEGACSVAAGCGAPRAAIRHLVSAQGIQREVKMEKLKAGATRAELVAHIAARNAEGLSDRDVRASIDAALRADEPGYLGIECVYPEERTAIYYVMPGDTYTLKRRKYSMDKDGVVALKGDGEEVRQVNDTTYEPVTAAAKPPQSKVVASAPCGCKKNAAGCGCKKKGIVSMTKAELIQSLITETKHSGFNESDTALLEAASDARLEEFRSAADARKAEAASYTRLESEHRNATARIKVQDERLRAAEAGMSDEEWMAKAPAHLKAVLERDKVVEDTYRGAIVSKLKDLGQHTEEELKKMSTPDLEKFAKYANVTVPDFSAARQAPRALSKNGDAGSYAPPSSYGLKKAAVN